MGASRASRAPPLFVLLSYGTELLGPSAAADTTNRPVRGASQSCLCLMRRTGIVREVGVSLRVGIAKALDVRRGEAERLATDGRCVGEWDGVLPKTGVTGTNVQLFAHNDDGRSILQRWYDVGGSNYLGNLRSF